MRIRARCWGVNNAPIDYEQVETLPDINGEQNNLVFRIMILKSTYENTVVARVLLLLLGQSNLRKLC